MKTAICEGMLSSYSFLKALLIHHNNTKRQSTISKIDDLIEPNVVHVVRLLSNLVDLIFVLKHLLFYNTLFSHQISGTKFKYVGQLCLCICSDLVKAFFQCCGFLGEAFSSSLEPRFSY
jgi:hypothetical protein